MESPFTGGPVTLKTELRELKFRKESYQIKYHYYLCEDTEKQFTTEELDQINITQVHNMYRKQHSIPFPEQMRNIRRKYQLSARKMSLILEFGENQYNQYENGTMPSLSNARLIQTAKDPEKFLGFLTDSGVYEKKKLEKMKAFIEKLMYKESRQRNFNITEYLLGALKPSEFNGFRAPNLERAMHMVLYFAGKLNPWETGLNKLMFYSDFLNFKRFCFSVSGTTYRAIQYGPVPQKYAALFDEAEQQSYVNIKYNDSKHKDTICKQFLPGEVSFSEDLFTQEELNTLHDVTEYFKGKKTTEIMDISHEETAWLNNVEEKQLINYWHAFDLKALD